MDQATISEKGWVVIPAALRKKYDLRPGGQVIFVDYGGTLAIVPALREPVPGAAGLVKGERSLTPVLRAERRSERARDQARKKRHAP